MRFPQTIPVPGHCAGHVGAVGLPLLTCERERLAIMSVQSVPPREGRRPDRPPAVDTPPATVLVSRGAGSGLLGSSILLATPPASVKRGVLKVSNLSLIFSKF